MLYILCQHIIPYLYFCLLASILRWFHYHRNHFTETSLLPVYWPSNIRNMYKTFYPLSPCRFMGVHVRKVPTRLKCLPLIWDTNVTLNDIDYYSHYLSFALFSCYVLYISCCLTLYHYTMNCWLLSLFNF